MGVIQTHKIFQTVCDTQLIDFCFSVLFASFDITVSGMCIIQPSNLFNMSRELQSGWKMPCDCRWLKQRKTLLWFVAPMVCYPCAFANYTLNEVNIISLFLEVSLKTLLFSSFKLIILLLVSKPRDLQMSKKTIEISNCFLKCLVYLKLNLTLSM